MLSVACQMIGCSYSSSFSSLALTIASVRLRSSLLPAARTGDVLDGDMRCFAPGRVDVVDVPVAAGRENGSRREDRKLLSHAVLVPAHIGGDQRVARQNLAHRREDAFRPHGVRGVTHVLGVALPELLAVGGNLAPERLVLPAGGVKFFCLAKQHAQRLL